MTDRDRLLFKAVQQRNNEIVVGELIQSGVDVNKADKDGKTPLFYAVQQINNESVVRELIQSGADVHKTDNDGKTALFYAVSKDAFNALIEEGKALISAKDHYGRTALFYIMENLNFIGAQYLIRKGGKLQSKDKCNVNVFSFFIENCIRSDVIVSKIFASDIFQRQKERYALIKAIIDIIYCQTPLLSISVGLHLLPKPYFIHNKIHLLEALAALQKLIPDAEEEKVNQFKTIIQIIKEKKIDVLHLLALLNELGADPNSADSDGNKALHYATLLPVFGVSQKHTFDICEKLRDFDAKFDAKNHQKETPLLFALSGNNRMELVSGNDQRQAVRGLKEVCGFLLKYGSSINDTSRKSKSVFHLMIELVKQNLEALRKNVLHESIELFDLFSCKLVGNPETITVANQRDSNLNSPLHLWASLELTASQDYINTVTTNHTFEEFLQIIFNHLLNCEARLNAKNKNDETPLHVCRTWSAVKILIKAGANPKDVDSSGRLPLLVAAKNKTFLKKLDCFYPDVSEDSKSFWKSSIAIGLDPLAVDKHSESVLSILIESKAFFLAKALVDVACVENYTQSETVANALLCAICKDKSTTTNWKTGLVKHILKSRKCRTPAIAPLRLCCQNIIETGVFDDKVKGETDSAKRTIVSEDHGISDQEPSTKKERGDPDEQISKNESQTDSVHFEILNILRVYGADCDSCLDLAETCPLLKDLLTKSPVIDEMSQLISWTSVSKKYVDKLAKVARRQDCDVINQFWLHNDHIGNGSFGHVFAGINVRDGKEVAIKRIEKLRMTKSEDKREIQNLITLAGCQQVVRYLWFFEDETFSYVVLELMEGNLDEYLDGPAFNKKNNIQLCEDVVKGLKYLHEHNILHRDLKPSNILYKTHPNLGLKIADFGLSRCISDSTNLSSVYGTRSWNAPEVLRCRKGHSKSSDVFSCGLVLYYILSVKKHPFSKNNPEIAHETEANIMDDTMEGWDDSLSPEATHLLKNALEHDKNYRPTAEQILEHPLFWSQKKKLDLLVAVGNQMEFECPRAKRKSPITAVEADLEINFSKIVTCGKWNDPGYLHMPAICTEMARKRRYDTYSVVELVRFIRNSYVHVSDSMRPTSVRRILLENFVFFEYFPHLVMEVYKAITTHGWDQTREEVKYAMGKY